MSGNLFGHSLSRRSPLSWRYALRIFLITVAFHLCPLLLFAIVDPHPVEVQLSELSLFLFFVLPYWGIFFLAVLSDSTNPMHRWRVWIAWLLVSAPFVPSYLMMLFGQDGDAAAATVFLAIMLVPFSPVIALMGAVAGQLLWHLFRLIRMGFGHNDRAESSST